MSYCEVETFSREKSRDILHSFVSLHTTTHTHTIHACTDTQHHFPACFRSLCSARLSNVTLQGDTLQVSPRTQNFSPTLPERQPSCFAVHDDGTVPSFPQPRLHLHAQLEQEHSLLPHGNPSATVTNGLSVCALGILTNTVRKVM